MIFFRIKYLSNYLIFKNKISCWNFDLLSVLVNEFHRFAQNKALKFCDFDYSRRKRVGLDLSFRNETIFDIPKCRFLWLLLILSNHQNQILDMGYKIVQAF